MSEVEIEQQPSEERQNSPPVDEFAHDEVQEVAVPQEQADENAENPQLEDEEEVMDGEDLSDPHGFKLAAHEVDECYMSVIRGLSAFSQEDEEVFGNAVEICKDLIRMEQNLFSETPSYVSQYIATHRAKTDAYNSTVQPKQTLPTAEGVPRDWEERRAYVDPGVPLMLPYNTERFKKEHPERAEAEGTYHDLFYGDGTQVVFEPPADNKRHQLQEAEKKSYHPSKQAPYSFEPQQKKPMRVSSDFVPSCAGGEGFEAEKRAVSGKKSQAKKSQRNSTS